MILNQVVIAADLTRGARPLYMFIYLCYFLGWTNQAVEDQVEVIPPMVDQCKLTVMKVIGIK